MMLPMFSSLHLSFILAWFIQMGIHEGAHAWAAWRCGDDTAYLLGKRTIDPLKHINWTEFNSVMLGVILPVMTAARGVPMGMAWVPVNPLRFRRMRRDHAIVAAAGPLSNFALALLLLGLNVVAVHYLYPFLDASKATAIEILLYAVYKTSIIYGIFNAIPLPPLDGSRVLYYFLPPQLRQVMDDMEPYGFWILILLFAFHQGDRVIIPAVRFFEMLWVMAP